MKKIGTILFMILLLAGCNKGGVDEGKEQLGLGIDNIAGDWTTSDSSKNPWSAKKLSISNTYNSQVVPNVVEAPTAEAQNSDKLNEYENTGLPTGTSVGKAGSKPGYCQSNPNLPECKKGSQSEDDNYAYSLNPNFCLTHPFSPVCKKKNPVSYGTSTGSGGSDDSSGSTEVMSTTQSLLSLYVTTVKSDGSTGPLSNTSAAGEESSSLIKLKLETTPEREDFYLIRAVSGITYLDICECESGECTDADHDRCYAYFKDIVDANTPGAFKKDLN